MPYRLIAKLERAVEQFRSQVANRHRLQRRSPKRLPKNKPLWDLPMMASSCCYADLQTGQFSKIYSDYSQQAKSNSYDSFPELRDRLLACAPPDDRRIGVRTSIPGCYNEVGRCAEPHAARKCLKDLPRRINQPIDSLLFSVAHTIKTGEPRNPCAICRAVFPQIRTFPHLR
ncbi:MAG: hypothetical protein K2H15_09340 [Muribaculaceae bacterium]|nr:hypothetical protein [Muribaculaceae bacterium]